LDFLNLQEVNKQSRLEDKARVFAKKGRTDNAWTFNNVIKFLQLQKERFNQREITAGTKTEANATASWVIVSTILYG
jgi:hypothetical protein